MRNVINAIAQYVTDKHLMHDWNNTSRATFQDTVKYDIFHFSWDCEALDRFLDDLQADSCDFGFTWRTHKLTSESATLYHTVVEITVKES